MVTGKVEHKSTERGKKVCVLSSYVLVRMFCTNFTLCDFKFWYAEVRDFKEKSLYDCVIKIAM